MSEITLSLSIRDPFLVAILVLFGISAILTAAKIVLDWKLYNLRRQGDE